jgi:myo-inositol 2-dehydrogenase / D-chiro-inositol 1-dehydrogenase
MNDPSPRLRLGIIGCGIVAARGHLPALRTVPEIEVVAAADIDPDRLRGVADAFQIPGRYADPSALIADPGVEAVAVCLPARLHVDVALAALEAGRHVFLEKPIALSLADAERLVVRANHSSLTVLMGFNLRRHRLVREARQLLRQGIVGRVELVRSVLASNTRSHDDAPAWRKRRQLGGGEFFETAVHHFDLWRFLLDTDIEEIFATSQSREWEDEAAAVTARLANGALATAMFSTRTTDANTLEIYGHEGRLSLSLMRFDGLEFWPVSKPSGDLPTRVRAFTRALAALPPALLRARQGGDFLDSYRSEWRHFAACIRQRAPVDCTLEDGYRSLEAILAAIESASQGRAVQVAPASPARPAGPNRPGSRGV